MGRVQESGSEYTPEGGDAAGYGHHSAPEATYEEETANYNSTYEQQPPQQGNTEAPPAPNQPPMQQYPPSQPPAYPPPPPPATQYPPAQQYPPKQGAYPPQMQQQHPAYQQPVQFPPPNPSAAAGGQPQYQAQYNQAPPPMSPYHQQTMGAPANGYPANQNPQVYVKPFTVGTNAWTTGLFDCMDDPINALTTAFFPCLTFGQIAEIIDSGHTTCATSGMLYGAIAFCIAMPCLMSCTYRTKLRTKFDLVEAPAQDWIAHFFCEWCALCQEYRELKNRGWDPDIGWHANVARQNQNVAMTPPMQQTMMQ